MTSPMDAGLMGQRVGMGANGSVVSNQGGQGGAGMGFDNPQPQNNYPPMQPPIPTAQPMGPTGTQPTGDQSPMESFQKKWFNKGQGGTQGNGQPTPNEQQAPAPQPNQQQQPNTPPANNGIDFSTMTAQQFQSLAQNMDFTQGIPDEIMEMFKADENGQQPNLMQGMMAMMNHVARGVYSQSLAGSGRLTGHGLSQFGERFTKDLPSHLQKHQATSVINSMKVPEALKPSVEGMVNHLLANNPNATTEQLTEMLDEFLGMFGGQRSGQDQGQQSKGIGDLFN